MYFKEMQHLLDRFTSWRIPGCTCVVYKGSEKVFKGSSGFSDMENNKLMNGDELMYMYSCTKVVTAVATMQLLEKGLLHIYDPLSYYIPDFANTKVKCIVDGQEKLKDPDREITLYDLVSMTAGYTYDIDNEEITKMRSETDGRCPTMEFVKAASRIPLESEPGEEWHYSICADITAGVVETVSGLKFRDYCRINIFEPLEMTDTSFVRDKDKDGRFAVEYEYDDNKGKPCFYGPQNNWFILGPEFDSGGAGVISTVDDMAKLGAALSCGGKGPNGNKILSSSAIDLMSQNHLSSSQSQTMDWAALKGYGYGVFVRTHIDRSISGSMSPLGEFGWTGAAGAFMVCDPINNYSLFYSHYMLNNQETYTNPRLRNVMYHCFD